MWRNVKRKVTAVIDPSFPMRFFVDTNRIPQQEKFSNICDTNCVEIFAEMLRMMQRTLFQPRLPAGCINTVVKKFPFQIGQVRCYSLPDENVESWVKTLDEAQQKRVRYIQNELALQNVENHPVPKVERLTTSDYKTILTLSQNQRHKYYTYLYKMHHSDGADFLKRQIRREIQKEKSQFQQDDDQTVDENKHIQYGLGKNSLIPKIYGRTVDKWKNTRSLWRTALGYPNMIFDCSYSKEMTPRENHEAAKQLVHCFGLNRSHREPFVLHFCGIDRTSLLWSFINKNNPMFGQKPLPIQLHDEPIQEAFPKEKLVLLTPDSPNILREYNPDDHYVISGLVDRGDKVPFTLAKAKRLEIRSARIPMEQFRKCRINKTLTLDQVMSVMLEIKYSGDWNEAFRYVADRKFY
ncbi:mitochondrial ribonuclease P protein 1 homolog [Sitodiplosis mosellana]|uniref:mitochondrial ribonuclease P protein 1 homolog n=1 Tax=Sitodiplosis mosellana TaxID=263140 RepID=UPI0024444E5C|nr:mitochondrial ribonuclease P protein 1 homolog [Sitodiplosis mosellana]